MKTTTLLMSIILISFVQLSIAQTINSYTFKVDTITFNYSKDFLTEVRNDLNIFDVRINRSDTSFSFKSEERYNRSYINSLTTPLGSEVIFFEHTFKNQSTASAPKNGGQDCWDAALVCNNSTISGNASGFGTQELDASNRGCLAGDENESSWYYLYVGSDGTLEMEINPDVNDDYDWAIWGPFNTTNVNSNCSPTGPPVRCSFALPPCNSWHWFWGCIGYDYTTGMGNGATDTSEPSGGNGWIAPLNVLEDEIYIMLIDNYSTSSDPFDLTWGGTANLDCTTVPLPVELVEFKVENQLNKNIIEWKTLSEKNNDHFIIQYSENGVNWEDIEQIDGAGTTTQEQNYHHVHREFEAGLNYYRLKQVDYDGSIQIHDIESIDNSSGNILVKRINTLGQEVDENYRGIVIEYYKNGEVRKYFKN